ncbi:MAG: hypothetical protein HZC42_10600 [Candidatus Eisenbacteria bacterium]|nr:hypothetical protein [Candidatus Eisenbacteria bacterium]
MSEPTLSKDPVTAPQRTRISCPGCGRNDYVSWPAGQDTFHWKCFNCHKQFELHRKRAH